MSSFDPASLVAQLRPFAASSRTWIALSGGLDSTVLLTAAAAVREQLPGALNAIHVDHGLHPASSDWAEFCRARCSELSIPFRVDRPTLTLEKGESLEAVARAARYQVFSDLLGPGDLLLTAHNEDDQAETLLLALLRGSGVHGLAAMPNVAPLGRGHLVRPLLSVARRVLGAYARDQGLKWIEDPSNSSCVFDRNYLRHQVLPILRARWPSVAATVSRSARHCAEAAGLVDDLAHQTLTRISGTRPGTLDIPALLALEPPLCRSVIRLWVRRLGFDLPDAKRLDRILTEVLPVGRDAAPLVAWSGCEIRRYRQDLFALAPLPEAPSSSSVLPWALGDDGRGVELPPGLGRLDWLIDSAAGARPKGQWLVRFGVAGQACSARPGGPSRSLRKLYQEAGVPAWLRAYVPLLFNGDRLIAVVGVSACLSGDAGDLDLGSVRWTGHAWESQGIFRADCGPIGR